MSTPPKSPAGCLLRGIPLLFKRGIRPYVFIPLAINIVLFAALAWLLTNQFEHMLEWLMPEDSWYSFLRWLLWPVFAITILLITFYSFTTLANLIGAPFNSVLSARIELFLSGREPQDHSGSLMREILPAISNELRKQSYFLIRAILLVILSVVPLTAPAAPVLWFLFSAWMLALEYLDYPMANHGMHFRQQRRLIKKRRAGALVFGSLLTGMMLIPGINLISMPAGVAGATLYWHHRLKAVTISS